MFAETPISSEENLDSSSDATINTSLSSNTGFSDSFSEQKLNRSLFKKGLFIVGLILGLVILAVAIFFIVKKYQSTHSLLEGSNTPVATDISSAASSTSAILPQLNIVDIATTTLSNSSLSGLQIEYLSFADFYQALDYKISPQIKDYSLPLNVKIDVMNYYDISRKLNLDPGLDDLNNQGFTLIKNPWTQTSSDFYSVYNNLNTNQVPLLISSDFIIYNYQNILKKSFKDIEGSVFYDNLWDINKQLYSVAKDRYEVHLSRIGDVNNSILEGERLELAFFAVSLELLKPSLEQISPDKTLSNTVLFTKEEADRFYFVVPPYLRNDVLAEEKLIRAANVSSTKSPVLLYLRDYKEFVVPGDYHANAKLNNFYLTTKWLNSVFPLNYRDKNCPDCLLDQADWRINLTAASFISQDFSLLPELKNKWARIYKVMSFFKGLREDLSYVNYRDSLNSLFGENYKINELFDDQNTQAIQNLEKLQTKLLTYKFPEISGGLDHFSLVLKPQIGFRMLAESYWPNDYIFSQLTAPLVGTYLGTSMPSDNTACLDKKTQTIIRCNGLALDVINLVYPLNENPYFSENTNYSQYNKGVASIQDGILKGNVWHLNNYWTTLNLIKTFLLPDKQNLPVFAMSPLWRNKEIDTAVSAWINLQLPLDNFSSNQNSQGTNISSFVQLSQNSYIEPNLNLVNELLADDNMLLGMLSALQLDSEVPTAFESIKNFSVSLTSLREIIKKELTGELLTAADNDAIVNFTRKFKLNSPLNNKSLHLDFPHSTSDIKEDINQLQLLVLIHQEGDNKVFSVGPVWEYQEKR